MSPLAQLYIRISQLPQVTIGEIRGRVRGAGGEFALSLDMRFASLERAVFGQPEVGSGLLPGAGGTQWLPALLGRARALEVILSSNDYDAAQAERYGWINRALPDSELSNFVDSLAKRIAAFPQSGIRNAKEMVNLATLPAESLMTDEASAGTNGSSRRPQPPPPSLKCLVVGSAWTWSRLHRTRGRQHRVAFHW
ncbi:MAG: enoyl-CoA hydratase/isomerase family protein [Rhodoferax sp.]|nr:enoyl-CoA hydratase/isomerase family protein [Rhodoferax sp.]